MSLCDLPACTNSFDGIHILVHNEVLCEIESCSDIDTRDDQQHESYSDKNTCEEFRHDPSSDTNPFMIPEIRKLVCFFMHKMQKDLDHTKGEDNRQHLTYERNRNNQHFLTISHDQLNKRRNIAHYCDQDEHLKEKPKILLRMFPSKLQSLVSKDAIKTLLLIHFGYKKNK